MLSVVKTDARQEARRLRALGWSVKEIERHLGVSRSSVSLWVRDVSLGEAEQARLISRIRLGPFVAGKRKADRARDVRRTYQEEGRRLARERDDTYAAGCMLYWGEGSKARNRLEICNSDPELVLSFVSFLQRHFAVPPSSMRLALNLFVDHLERQREIEDFWLQTLGLERTALTRTQVNRYSKYSQKKRNGRLPYGTASLRVHSTQIVQTIYGSIQEYGGFDRPEWLG
jgi:transcriptional regulator with XRE-family HTH domain